MKFSRRKKVNRYMHFFKNNFGFHVPYQLLIDGTFCLAALQEKINIREQLPKYFKAEVKLLTTQCVVLEMEKLGPAVYGALQIAKQFAVHKCGHEKDPIPASKCFESMIAPSNQMRYIIVTQDVSLREAARQIPGTPVLYLHFKAPTLERPSSYSEDKAKSDIDSRIQVADFHLNKLRKLKAEEFGDTKTVVHRRKKKKGPNPLSCKKKKKKAQLPTKRLASESAAESSDAPKKKRKRIKIAKHIKEELKQKSTNSNPTVA